MKRLLLLLFFIALIFQIKGQNNVFVMVDVSQSGARQFKEKEGQSLIADIILANYTKNNHPDWKVLDDTITDSKIKQILMGKGSSLVANNSVVGVLEIGNYNRHLTHKSFDRLTSNSDFTSFLSRNYPKNVWTDSKTIIELPMAWLAGFLKNENLTEYFVFIISDEQQDKGNPGSLTQYSYEDKKMIADYGKGSKKPEKICTLNASSNGKEMFLTIWKIDLTGNPIKPITNTGIVIPEGESLKIELTTFKDGTIQKPCTVNNNKFTVSWFCKNAPKNMQYKIKLSPNNISGEKPQSYITAGNSYSFQNIADGTWKISIQAASPEFKASSANSTIEVNAGGPTWLYWLLPIAGIIGGGVWWMRKMKNDKIKKLNSFSDNDSFSSGSKINTNSDSSGYF